MVELVRIIRSEEESLIGVLAKVIEIEEHQGGIDYRIQTGSGYEAWVPCENIEIIH
ncbi:SH3 domain-containing protein [Paenibacillus sp. E194]|uniref:SH3 domain-containing protein n=1 Tax=Paenibacillus sp. E194 TaxID=1458845 RepID=UPI000A833518|nr:SH3 domain-containing protein [Paenibacillus sp. E194]